jgi:hypothetical protein
MKTAYTRARSEYRFMRRNLFSDETAFARSLALVRQWRKILNRFDTGLGESAARMNAEQGFRVIYANGQFLCYSPHVSRAFTQWLAGN